MSVPPVPKRSLAERVVFWGVVLTAFWNLGRAVILISQLEWIAEVTTWPNPHLRPGLAILWSALFFVAAIGLRWRLSWFRVSVPLLLAIYGVYELVMMITFAARRPEHLLILAYTGFVLFSGWVMWRPASGFYSYFRHKGGR